MAAWQGKELLRAIYAADGMKIVGELFGMNRRYRRGVAVAKSGRTVELDLPAPHRESYAVIHTIGWIADDGR